MSEQITLTQEEADLFNRVLEQYGQHIYTPEALKAYIEEITEDRLILAKEDTCLEIVTD